MADRRTEFVKIATQLIASELEDAVAQELTGLQVTGADTRRRGRACAEYLASRFIDAPTPETETP